MQKDRGNIYIPVSGRIEEIIQQTGDVKLFRLRAERQLNYSPGQFFMVSVWGAGEIPISVASLHEGDTVVELCIRRVGLITTAIHSLGKGDPIYLRGPYGNGFPFDLSRDRNVVVVAGGIGMAPLRPLIQWFIKNPEKVGKVTFLYGAKTPDDMPFRDEARRWRQGGIKVVLTVDKANAGWQDNVGLVTGLWHEVRTDFKESMAYICGPEVMIKTAMGGLSSLGMPDERITATLEAHMKCGVGKCGHCYAGPKYICTDGPVFSYSEIKQYGIL